MSFQQTSSETFSWACDGKVNLGSPCIQRSIIDVINLLFLLAFFLLLLSTSTRKYSTNNCWSYKRDRVFVVVSICCGLISISHFGLCLWNLTTKTNHGSNQLNWLSCFVRGLVWICLIFSLLVQGTKWTRILATLWWVSFLLLITALNLRILLGGQSLGVLEILSWPLNFLLLFCAFRSYSLPVPQQKPDQHLSEPLLSSKASRSRPEIGHAGFLSKLVFSWVNPLLALGYLKPLSFEDIPSLVPEDEANLAYQKFSQTWDSLIREKNLGINHGNLVIKAIIKVYFKENMLICLYAFLRTISVVVSPLLIYMVVEYSGREEDNLSQGLRILVSLVIIKVVESLSQRHYYFNSRRSGMRMRSALMAAVYGKQLKLSSLGRRRHSMGEVVNYIAVDAYRMGEFPWWFHLTWSFTLQLFLAILVLFLIIGTGAIPGLVPLFISCLLNVPFAKILQNYQSKFMKAQDERLRATSEILNCMKIIKLQSWEEKFRSQIELWRDTEFKWLAKTHLTKAYGAALYWLSPTVISSIVFLGCVLLGSSKLDASTIFTVLATLRVIAEPVRYLPESLSFLIQVMVSFDRINTFLLDDELKGDRILKVADQSSDTTVAICSGNFSWNLESPASTLKNINLEVKRGEKIAVCGLVGAGKSSLLYAVLGDVTRTSGTVKINGSLAYVSQTSWIQSGTIRDNILFGKPMEEERYFKAIKACALDKDIHSFDHGDLTEIGQRGINMSGGQKQRIQLARAVYNDADIYLLDDPFSAVDAHTAAILFNECVMTALEKKTVILVTHQVEFLSEVDRILVMERGELTQSGTYKELSTSGTGFEQLVNAHREAITTLGLSNNVGLSSLEQNKGDILFKTSENRSQRDGPQLTKAEEKEAGDAGLKPMLDYISISKGTPLLLLGTAAQLGFVVLQSAGNYWLAIAIRFPKISSSILIGIFTGLSTLSVIFVHMRTYSLTHLGLRASKAFFSGFTSAIFKAPMLFFDATPVGRILTRASSDMSVLDFDIPFAAIYLFGTAFDVIAIILIMASVTWQVLIVAIFGIVAAYYAQEYYLQSGRELARINGTTKAPVMNFASETSLGVVTIRAFDMVDRFFLNFMTLIDADAKPVFYSNAMMEWLILRIETLQNLTIFTNTLLLVFLPRGKIDPGLAGLSLSYAFTLTSVHFLMVRWYCNLSIYAVSIERIKQFMNVPPEPAAVVEDHRPPSSWPSEGRIELEELKIRYRPNAPLVLKGITCTFKERSRVGVVGRTGSGKTTLIGALFRIVEPASGRICIDGIDITTIGLKDLRMKLSIIPQEPTLFRGTVRTNMDPLGLYSDTEIWEVLEKCQLKAIVSSLPKQLDSSVSDDGENWSAGQRQLFCLGRVLLRRNRILVLDEATASIDSATDASLQRIIRKEFSECTVITVAHRVPTVIDSDMVMVLSYGELVEYEEPTKLMESNSYFSKLVTEYWSSCRRNSQQNLMN